MDSGYYREDEVLSCQDQLGEFKETAGMFMKWLDETKQQALVVQPNYSDQGLRKDLQKINVSDLAKTLHLFFQAAGSRIAFFLL